MWVSNVSRQKNIYALGADGPWTWSPENNFLIVFIAIAADDMWRLSF